MKLKLVILTTVIAVTFAACVPTAPPTLHFTVNEGSDTAGPTAAGFNILDTGPTKADIDALPAGDRAMVWLGNLDNTACDGDYTLADFQSRVDTLANDPKVYGFYISDEPHPTTCSTAPADIRVRADYIHTHAPGKQAFVVVLNSSNDCGSVADCEFATLKPSITHVDLIGIDPYPCHNGAPCDISKIDSRLGLARAAGIPDKAIVPTFQTFGQGASGYYRLPTAAELKAMLDRWDALLPHPVMDYSYTWGTQGSSPEALSTSPELRAVISTHNSQP